MLDIEHLKNGVLYWHENDKMDDLMEFLVRYVRHIHSDRYYRTLLIENVGATFLDIITPSDIAYVVALMRNGVDMWTTPKDANGKKVKPLFTSGEKMKRTFAMNIWNADGMAFYNHALACWRTAFDRNSTHYAMLHKYWDNWVVRNGKTLIISKSESGHKTAFSVLATREEAEVARRRDQGARPRPVVEFEYDMNDEAGSYICAGKWGAAMTGNTIRQGSNSQDNDERDDVEGDESEEDDDENNQEVVVIVMKRVIIIGTRGVVGDNWVPTTTRGGSRRLRNDRGIADGIST